MTARDWTCLLTAAALGLAGCGRSSAGANAPGTGSEACGVDRVIEDGEDGDDRILTVAARGGYLYTYVDETGSTVSPVGEFIMSSPGAQGSANALRTTGVLTQKREVYGGMGLSFTEPRGPYDASAYRGVSFYAKRSPPYHAFVRLKLPDVNTDPRGGVCSTDCYNDFGIEMELTDEWRRYVAPFAALTQEEGWGDPRPPAIDTSRLFGIQWQVSSPGAMFDFWVDNIEFVCELPPDVAP